MRWGNTRNIPFHGSTKAWGATRNLSPLEGRMANDIIDTRDDSPFPSASMMDLDMMRAGSVFLDYGPDQHARRIESVGETNVALVYGTAQQDPARDLLCRRIEMMGDMFETLRRAAEKMAAAGLDAREEHEVLAAFVVPKPYGQGG